MRLQGLCTVVSVVGETVGAVMLKTDLMRDEKQESDRKNFAFLQTPFYLLRTFAVADQISVF